MRRFQFPNAALVAGLAVLLSGCAGETPTAPGSVTPPGGVPSGSCTTLVSLTATTDNPFAGSGSIVRATVTRAGVPVPDGGSVQFTTSLGTFGENGLNTISKTTVGGVADVTVLSLNSGTAQVTGAYDCARAQKALQFQGVPDTGPVITSFLPTNGTCAGGDTVTIQGVRLGNGTGVRVFFGGIEGSVTSSGNTQIKVLTPARTLKNPAVPESVPVVVVVNGVSSPAAATLFTYACIPDAQKMSISSITPTAGSPAGGDIVQILGRNFGTNIATTLVTFCGAPAQIVAQQDQQITVTTPRHALANPAISETCDVVVTRDIGLVSQQSATLFQAFTYRGNGSGGICNTDPTFFIASLTPNSGPPDGGTTITLTGSGFGSTASLLRVDFGGTPATIVAISNTTIVVSTPRRTLASPNVPETVDVTVTDLGSPVQRCARVVSGFVYTAAALDPVIYSTSPKTGPNDSSTRVSIFGTGFQFPMQVFMTGGSCGLQRVEGVVSDISLTTIVFKTPVATNNVCLLNQLVDIVILNPSTGKTATCPACFKYYSCPTVGNASPSVANGTVSTTVVISGANFEEPVTANFRVGSSLVALNVTSVSSNAIVVTMPPVSQILGGSPACGNVDGTIEITFLSLACTPSPLLVPFTYRIDPPVATTASPNNLNQDGSAFPGPLGTPVTVTVVGNNFTDPMTVQLIKDGSVVSNTAINNATVSNSTSLSFSAPAVLNSSLNQQSCLLGGTVSGTKSVATSFGIRLKSTRTGCSVDLPNVLVYNPIDTLCHAALTITTAALPAGTATVLYGPVTMAAVGGTGVGYSWSASGLPAAMVINAATGTISGTPAVAGTYTVTVSVTDSAANTGLRTYSLQVN
jgi:large repetitive protein